MLLVMQDTGYTMPGVGLRALLNEYLPDHLPSCYATA